MPHTKNTGLAILCDKFGSSSRRDVSDFVNTINGTALEFAVAKNFVLGFNNDY